MPFVHFLQRPDTLTADFASAEYEKLGQRSIEAEGSPSPEGWLSLFRDGNALRAYVRGEEVRLYFRHTQDTRDEVSAAAERRIREEVTPRAEHGESRLMSALLLSRHRDAVAAEFGEQLLRVLQVRQASLAPINAQLRVELGQFANEYDQLLANAEVSVGGQAMTLSRARGLMSSGSADYDPALTLRQGVAEPIAEQLDKAERVFAKLSPKLCGHFRRMRARGLIDLENRPGKAMGGYSADIYDANEVLVFCNSVGNETDVRVLTHEMGHAFQSWESQWIEAVMLRSPTADAAEVHSMGMEFLCLPHLGEFFSADELVRFTLGRWKRTMEVICYACVVDHFQHWVYEHPDASADERDHRWTTLQDVYMPGIDWSGEAESFRSCRWYSQLHIFHLPFYFIDYAIAEIGAMQLARLAEADSEGTLARYLELCRLGGTRSVLGLFAAAGLRPPFDPEVTSGLGDHVRKVLLPRRAG